MKTSLLVALLCIVVGMAVAAAILRTRRSSSVYRRRFVNGAPMRERPVDSSANDLNAAVFYPVVLMTGHSSVGSNCDAGSSSAGDAGCSDGGGATGDHDLQAGRMDEQRFECIRV